MSNKVLFGVLGTTAATATIAAPATLLSGGGTSIGEGGGSQGNFQEPIWVGKDPELTSSTNIKEKYKEVDCLKNYFGEEINWNGDNSQLEAEPKLDLKSTDKGNPKGCLIVEYYQGYPKKDNKWWGGFRLIWSVANDKEGLITVFNSRTKNGSFSFDSAVYIVGKEDQKWSLKYQQENSEGIISEETELDTKFPKAKSSLFDERTLADWGFWPNITQICKGIECKTSVLNSSDAPMRWNWQKNSSGKSISEWSENFDNWFDNLLADNKDKWSQVKGTLKELKGTWTKSN